MNCANVILVNERDEAIGAMEKMEAHLQGRLHRAFSIFIINDSQEMLLQQRSLKKYHSPGVWTNACCSHPCPGEETTAAASRRLFEELGFRCPLEEVDAFTYFVKFDNGLAEHEFDHIYLGRYSGVIQPDPEEVQDYKFLRFSEIDSLLLDPSSNFSYWFKLAYPLLKKAIGLN